MGKQKKPTRSEANSATRKSMLEKQSQFDLIMGARLARQLGISATTFWRWRKLPGFPTGRRIQQHIYFSQSDVQDWLDRQQKAA